jgi:hypothetical protein
MKNAVFWEVTPCGSVRTDVSEQRTASIIRVTRIGELGKKLALSSNRRTLRRNTIHSISSSETSVLARATWRNIQEDGILHSHRRKYLKSYIEVKFRATNNLQAGDNYC